MSSKRIVCAPGPSSNVNAIHLPLHRIVLFCGAAGDGVGLSGGLVDARSLDPAISPVCLSNVHDSKYCSECVVCIFCLISTVIDIKRSSLRSTW